MIDLAGKVAIVTGGAQGVGGGISRCLAQSGAKVLIADIDFSAAENMTQRVRNEGGTAYPFEVDVTSYEALKNMINEAKNKWGALNILVNNAYNAADGQQGGVLEVDEDRWADDIRALVTSVYAGCKYAIPIMKNYSPGSIINTSSISGLIAGHNMASYNTAKAGVWMLSKSVALHCARQAYNIRCNSIHPTFINTPILDNMLNRSNVERDELLMKLARQVPLGKVGEPNDVAYTVLFLASDESKFITGSEIKIDGGIIAM